jgi:hypothetical protein
MNANGSAYAKPTARQAANQKRRKTRTADGQGFTQIGLGNIRSERRGVLLSRSDWMKVARHPAAAHARQHKALVLEFEWFSRFLST